MTRAILNLHRLNTDNVGDLRCGPYQYFPDLLGRTALEILGFRSEDAPDARQRARYRTLFAEAEMIVIGGGGLLEIDFFKPALRFIEDNIRKDRQKLVIWGAGHNAGALHAWRGLKPGYTFERGLFDLIGVRDSGHPGLDWVPCASCMSDVFDSPRSPERAVGVYAHADTLRDPALRAGLPAEFDLLDNSAGFDTAIDFLGSSELVLTDSFHGAYWATLLGRRVVAFPTTSKFYDLRHMVPLCAPQDWERASRLARSYPDALEDCRKANRHFARRVEALLNS